MTRYLSLQKTSKNTGSFFAFRQELKGDSKKSQISPVSQCKNLCSELVEPNSLQPKWQFFEVPLRGKSGKLWKTRDSTDVSLMESLMESLMPQGSRVAESLIWRFSGVSRGLFSHCNPWSGQIAAPIAIFKAHDIVFAQVGAALHLD